MRKYLITGLKISMAIIILIVAYFVGVLIINTAYDYKPITHKLAIAEQYNAAAVPIKTRYSMLSWNIGYAGLGSESDFFYDGGDMVKPCRRDYDRYYQGILNKIVAFDSLDFILLQEVDTASARSYYINQYADISQILMSYQGTYVKNYDAFFVPLPAFNPMGQVVSGLASFSVYPLSDACIQVFPDNYPWPKNLFMPDRCFMCISTKLSSGNNLHVINTHNSAFDDGSLRITQLKILFKHMKTLYDHGDYVIAGGDWNINPPGYSNLPFLSDDISFSLNFSTTLFTENPDWKVVFDENYPSNRDVSIPYTNAHTPATIIDYFLCSPNVRVLESKTLYNNFQYSDHQPVYLSVSLN
ncbi:MAG: endonuclease/exonuclease/phosphatase family protein [Bacteroidota bacterium]